MTVSTLRWQAVRVECPGCGGDTTVTSTGRVYGHRTRRVGRDGKQYIAADTCPAGGKPYTEEATS